MKQQDRKYLDMVPAKSSPHLCPLSHKELRCADLGSVTFYFRGQARKFGKIVVPELSHSRSIPIKEKVLTRFDRQNAF